ncbi:ADP-ribosylglycohydrolase family protein [Thioalkalivibrio sp.]|uniref:ADP-ribosylglycohydrolase family protein n=1 Tax=Thioalkalivibrio sp. TaxID=2093813 RepID=UPI003976367B
MIGAIAGDIIGSIHEGAAPQPKDFPLFVSGSRFTDDTVLTVAVASAVLSGTDYGSALRGWGRRYPEAGYGGWFRRWLFQDDAPAYSSFGNGSAMRVSAIGWAFEDLETVLQEASRSAEVTHNHPKGILGAQAVAGAVWAGRMGRGKDGIERLLSERFGYDCDLDWAALQRRGGFDISCQGTVPAAAAAFLRSTDFEDAVRNAVSLGGDADTLACIAGAMAEAHYGCVPDAIQVEAMARLDPALRTEVRTFAQRYGVPIMTAQRSQGTPE